MSTAWNVLCLTCEEKEKEGRRLQSFYPVLPANGHDYTLSGAQDLIDAAELFAAFAERRHALHLRVSFFQVRQDHGTAIDVRWFLEHRGHHLIPRDEYGVCLGECGSQRGFPRDGTDAICRRPAKHAGAHSERREERATEIVPHSLCTVMDKG